MFLSSELGKINFKNESSSGYVEGSQISFYCYENRNKLVVATCMKNGNWSPDPHTYKCQNNETREVTSKELSYYAIDISLVYNINSSIGSRMHLVHPCMKIVSWVHIALLLLMVLVTQYGTGFQISNKLMCMLK